MRTSFAQNGRQGIRLQAGLLTVERHQVGASCFPQVQQARGVNRFTQDLDALLVSQQLPQGQTYLSLFVGDQYAYSPTSRFASRLRVQCNTDDSPAHHPTGES